MEQRKLKPTTLERFCYYCGNRFTAINGRNIFCSELCEFKNWRETRKAKLLRYQKKIKRKEELN